ncbi:hypothetical protein [Yinghuangia soli]|uniref:Uncharacterized protein n=1 Tax=Yinghuangia soli TaxID=2908204 RepID=A0AA41Q2Q5_9ACTN|nr:hypothetical protein [Yinghuangia soli]MCF2529017.1 hypothetical protein [Yinghuangia soli]
MTSAPAPARSLSAFQRWWRGLAAALGIALIVHGSLLGNDDQFPFAPMSMFAFRTDPNGNIDAHYLEADTDAGTRIKVPMSRNGAGMGRAELEGQLLKIIADPALLQNIADTQRRLQPGLPHYTHVYVMRDRTVLRDGAKDHTVTEQLADWAVR